MLGGVVSHLKRDQSDEGINKKSSPAFSISFFNGVGGSVIGALKV